MLELRTTWRHLAADALGRITLSVVVTFALLAPIVVDSHGAGAVLVETPGCATASSTGYLPMAADVTACIASPGPHQALAHGVLTLPAGHGPCTYEMFIMFVYTPTSGHIIPGTDIQGTCPSGAVNGLYIAGALATNLWGPYRTEVILRWTGFANGLWADSPVLVL